METPQKIPKKYAEEDILKERVDHAIEHRIPWLLFGLLGGLLTTVIVSNYEAIISADVRLAFFIPIIVYLSNAVSHPDGRIIFFSLNARIQ
jgi:magnesium transporter